MIKGLYTAASGMLASKQRLNVVSNNLANSDTTGYKKEGTVRESFPEMLINKIDSEGKEEIGSLGTGVRNQFSYTDFSSGKLKHTSNPLDLAIQGEGFFVVETPAGQRYTKNGNFTLNEVGQIVTQEGYPLLNEEGEPMQTIDNRSINFDGEGQLYLDDLEAGNVQVVDFEDNRNLEKVGENLYQLADEGVEAQEAENYQIRQGYQEASNVNVVKEMTNMIEANRHYEMNQRAIKTADQTLEKTVNQVGRIG